LIILPAADGMLGNVYQPQAGASVLLRLVKLF
jgi:hypothetical protein